MFNNSNNQQIDPTEISTKNIKQNFPYKLQDLKPFLDKHFEANDTYFAI
jgi:hypothetical protein